MAKIWVEFVTNVLPDNDETKKALTKAVKEKIETDLVNRTLAAMPKGKYSNKESDKPKDKRDDHAARAVRVVETLKYKVEAEGKTLYSSGKLTMGVELLKLKSKDEKGELAPGGSKNISNVKSSGTFAKDFEAATGKLMDELVGPLTKQLFGSQFESFAKQHDLPLD